MMITWNVRTGQRNATLEGHNSWLRDVVFSPNGEQLVSASEDHTVKIWDSHTGQCLKTFRGHIDEVLTLAISPTQDKIGSST